MFLLLFSLANCRTEEDKNDVSLRTVKIVGTSARDTVEGFETGLLISSTGDVVTVSTPLLDSKNLRIILSDNRSYPARLLGTDPKSQIAYLRTTAADVPFFDLSQAVTPPKPGDSVWGTTNRLELLRETKPLDSKRLTVLRIDDPSVSLNSKDRTISNVVVEGCPNRAGSFGGALTNDAGQLIGMIAGPERNNSTTELTRHIIPVREVRNAVSNILEGKIKNETRPLNRDFQTKPNGNADPFRGIILLPEELDQTPAYVDGIKPESPAHHSGLQTDDLILYAGSSIIRSSDDLRLAFRQLPPTESISLTVMRGDEIQEVELGGLAPKAK